MEKKKENYDPLRLFSYKFSFLFCVDEGQKNKKFNKVKKIYIEKEECIFYLGQIFLLVSNFFFFLFLYFRYDNKEYLLRLYRGHYVLCVADLSSRVCH